MEPYFNVLKMILDQGSNHHDRTKVGTLSYFAPPNMRFDLKDNKLPLMTEKQTWYKGILHELLWFLSGGTNIKYLVDNNVHIWDEWAFERFPHKDSWTLQGFADMCRDNEEFAKRWGELGPVYGKQWRKWKTNDGEIIDQIANIINDLQTNPNSRRHIVSAWNVGEIKQTALPPCHLLFQFKAIEMTIQERYVQYLKLVGRNPETQDSEWENDQYLEQFLEEEEAPKYRLQCLLYQRSADMFLGVPFNIASYAMLTQLIAWQVNMIADELIIQLGDAHIYNNHIDQCEELIRRHESGNAPSFPTWEIGGWHDNIEDYVFDDFTLQNYSHMGKLTGEVAV